MKTKVLYITPHLSTGGLPQYLLTKIREHESEIEPYVIEWDDITGGKFIVQRKQILNLAKDFWTLYDKSVESLKKIIDQVQPDIVHFEEIAETFINAEDILSFLFNEDREYLIAETTHGSFTNSNIVRYIPDHFIFPTEYCYDNFKSLGVPMSVWDIPITPRVRELTKEQAKKKLGITTCGSCKHVLVVGLFTPGKNQAEAFEIARHYEHHNIYFHFIGNQADNFRNYWEPLMADKPENCYVWGEREDVDVFYQACDFMLFPSKFELNPLVVKEALSWDLPVMMYRLHTYMNKYDSFRDVYYMSQDPMENNDMIMKIIKDAIYKKPETVKPIDKSKEIVAVLTHADTDEKKDLLKRCLTEMKKQGYKTIVSTHIHDVTEDIHDLIDYIIYDKDNPVITSDEYEKYGSYLNYTYSHPAFDLVYNMKYNHGYAAMTLMKNASKIAEVYGFEKIHFVNYDYILTDPSVLIEHSTILENNDVVSYTWGVNPTSITTGLFSTKVKLFNVIMQHVNSKESYAKIGRHVCEENMYELYNKSKKKISFLDYNTLKEKAITNKIAVKVLPIHDINENTEVGAYVLTCLCIDPRGQKYLIVNYNTSNQLAEVKIHNTRLNYMFKVGYTGPSKFKVSDELLEEGINIEINGKLYETINKDTDTGIIRVKLENEFLNLENLCIKI